MWTQSNKMCFLINSYKMSSLMCLFHNLKEDSEKQKLNGYKNVSTTHRRGFLLVMV